MSQKSTAASRVRSRSTVAHIVDHVLLITRDKSVISGGKVVSGGIKINEAFPKSMASLSAESIGFLNNASKFCFPYEEKLETISYDPRTFTFVLTDGDGNQQFGFCRHIPKVNSLASSSSSSSSSSPSPIDESSSSIVNSTPKKVNVLQPGLQAITTNSVSVTTSASNNAAAAAAAPVMVGGVNKSGRSQFDLECICILSYLPWFEVFEEMLDKLTDLRKLTKQPHLFASFVNSLYNLAVPKPNETFTVYLTGVTPTGPPSTSSNNNNSNSNNNNNNNIKKQSSSGPANVPFYYSFHSPDDHRLWKIPENLCLSQLCVFCLSSHTLLAAFAALLMERRVIVFSTKLSRVSSCVHALSHLLYPLYWQHVFIPIMPPHLLDYCSAPMPYFIGVHSSQMDKIAQMPLEEVVVVDIDENRIIYTEQPNPRSGPQNDIFLLPYDITHTLFAVIKKAQAAADDVIARAFLNFFLSLFGNYQEFIVVQSYNNNNNNSNNNETTASSKATGVFAISSGYKLTFDLEGLIASKPRQVSEFLNVFLRLQMFQQFITEQLHKSAVNGGEALGASPTNSTLFEREAYKQSNSKYKRYTRPAESKLSLSVPSSENNAKLSYALANKEKLQRKTRSELSKKQLYYSNRKEQLQQMEKQQQNRTAAMLHTSSANSTHNSNSTASSTGSAIPPSSFSATGNPSSGSSLLNRRQFVLDDNNNNNNNNHNNQNNSLKRSSLIVSATHHSTHLPGSPQPTLMDKKAPPPRPPPPKSLSRSTSTSSDNTQQSQHQHQQQQQQQQQQTISPDPLLSFSPSTTNSNQFDPFAPKGKEPAEPTAPTAPKTLTTSRSMESTIKAVDPFDPLYNNNNDNDNNNNHNHNHNHDHNNSHKSGPPRNASFPTVSTSSPSGSSSNLVDLLLMDEDGEVRQQQPPDIIPIFSPNHSNTNKPSVSDVNSSPASNLAFTPVRANSISSSTSNSNNTNNSNNNNNNNNNNTYSTPRPNKDIIDLFDTPLNYSTTSSIRPRGSVIAAHKPSTTANAAVHDPFADSFLPFVANSPSSSNNYNANNNTRNNNNNSNSNPGSRSGSFSNTPSQTPFMSNGHAPYNPNNNNNQNKPTPSRNNTMDALQWDAFDPLKQ